MQPKPSCVAVPEAVKKGDWSAVHSAQHGVWLLPANRTVPVAGPASSPATTSAHICPTRVRKRLLLPCHGRRPQRQIPRSGIAIRSGSAGDRCLCGSQEFPGFLSSCSFRGLPSSRYMAAVASHAPTVCLTSGMGWSRQFRCAGRQTAAKRA